ncbi:GNAT family N-acetyltransferase [Bacteroidota bacterium]
MDIENLTASDQAEIVDVLTDAFFDYPVFTTFLKDADSARYEHHLRLLCGFFADARLMRGWPVYGIREDEHLAAAILVSDPEFMPRPAELDAVYDKVSGEVGRDVMAQFDALDRATASFQPKTRTYFVGMVGVRPSSQGKGFGRILLDHVAKLSLARPESSGVTLTTETEANVAFYEHLGYRVLGKGNVGGLTSWLFFLEH